PDPPLFPYTTLFRSRAGLRARLHAAVRTGEGLGMNIPYTVEERPDSGLANGKLGIWLFLASEVMLFGALFSTYIILRVGAPESGDRKSTRLNSSHVS